MMKATLETINTVSQAVSVEVSPEMVTQCRVQALAQVGKEMKVPGFREGKIPPEMVAQRLRPEALAREIAETVVRATYLDAIRQVGARPISDPHIEAKPYEASKPFHYRAVFDVYPTVVVDEYAGFKLECQEVEVSDAEMTGELEVLRQRMTQLEPVTDATVDAGMVALIDFKGTAGGKPFTGSEAKNFVVDYGAGRLLSQFETEIRGMKAGEHRHITFTYPNDYFNKDVAGKAGEFDVEVKDVRRKIVPELDDDFAKGVGKQNLAEVRDDIRKRIGEVKEELERRKLHRQVIEELAKKYPIDVPETMISAELSSMLEGFNRELEARGQTLEQAGVTAEIFVKQNYEEAKLRTRGFLLVSAIAKKENLAVTPDERETRLNLLSARLGQPLPQLKAHIEKNNLLPRIEGELLLEKALDFVVAKSKIKRVKPKK
ncbi:MAG: trigger factor [Deltaproteobacteria bacterium]|nr:trigger factor [Deltaproteobacteria bacterium]